MSNSGKQPEHIPDLVLYPDVRLKTRCQEIEVFDSELQELCKTMLAAMYHYKGIGLAACQVGILKRIFTMDVSNSDEATSLNDKPYIFINPEILDQSVDKNEYQEGCLSFPSQSAFIERPSKITVKYQDMYGNLHEVQADGLAATCIQHELDHLNGIVMPDRVSSIMKKSSMLKKAEKIKASF